MPASRYTFPFTPAIFAAVLAFALPASRVSAQPWFQQAKLTSADAAPNDYFGYAVAVSGNTLVIGAQGNDDAGPDSGSAYVFVRTGGVWTQQAKLTAGDAFAGDIFGTCVAISGDTIVVGAPQNDDGAGNAGSAYVFTRSGTVWTQQQELNASDPSTNAGFGSAVGIAGDTVIVGASGAASFAGAGYIFGRTGSTWTQLTKLNPSHNTAGDTFGAAVAISGNTVVVGAYQADGPGASSGWAYVFTGSGSVWAQQARIIPSDTAGGDLFGESVSISGDTIAISAHRNDDAGADSGSAYVFTRAGGVWTEQAKLTANDAAAGDIFGYSVSVSGDVVAVGAPFNDDSATDSGSAYAFRRSGTVWTQDAKFNAADAATLDELGFGVAVDGDTLVAGVQLDDDAGTGSGSAYVFFYDALGPVASGAVLDLTRAGGTIDGTFSASDGNGIGVASVALHAKPPGGAWASAGPVTGGTFSYSPAAGDGEYRFAIVGTDTYGNVGTTPTGSDPGDVAVLWNDVPNSSFAYAAISDGTLIFPMTNDLDQTISFSGGATGGPISMSRTTGDTAPAGTNPALVIDESLSISGTFNGFASITWNFDPASDDALAGPLDTVLQFEAGALVNTYPVTPSGTTLTIGPLTSFSDWYAGSADARVEDWTLLK